MQTFLFSGVLRNSYVFLRRCRLQVVFFQRPCASSFPSTTFALLSPPLSALLYRAVEAAAPAAATAAAARHGQEGKQARDEALEVMHYSWAKVTLQPKCSYFVRRTQKASLVHHYIIDTMLVERFLHAATISSSDGMLRKIKINFNSLNKGSNDVWCSSLGGARNKCRIWQTKKQPLSKHDRACKYQWRLDSDYSLQSRHFLFSQNQDLWTERNFPLELGDFPMQQRHISFITLSTR